MVEQEHIGTLADSAKISERVRFCGDRPAVHAKPQTVRSASTLGCAIVQIPDLDAAIIVPLDPKAVRLVVPILLSRKRLAVFVLKLLRAVFAIADAGAT